MSHKTIAILGATASGKTALSIDVAKSIGANILSLDSLSIFKQINIASAKPSVQERDGIPHYGIDILNVDESFNVVLFFDIFKKAKKQSILQNRHLILVGGTGFYLKSLMEGLSHKPNISQETSLLVQKQMQNSEKAYDIIRKNDPAYASKISSNDSYRIEKWLEIFFESQEIPSQYFQTHERTAICKDIKLFEIMWDKDALKNRISLRTEQMIHDGLIDEVFHLEKNYGRLPKPMASIGIKETLTYLDGLYDKTELLEKITTNTARLAKRQRTFNKSQFPKHPQGSIEEVKSEILQLFT